MIGSILMAAALLSPVPGAPANAAGEPPVRCASPLLGTWRLQSYVTEYADGRKVQTFGAHPSGVLAYSADCRMIAILVREGRKVPAQIVPTEPEKAALFDGMGAYAGTFTVDGNTVRHHVDVSWIESWTGTTQVREFHIEGNVLRIHSVPAIDPEDGEMSSATLVWTKLP